MQLFYAKDIKSDYYVLDEEESKHCIRILRHVTGDKLMITDGLGNIYETEIIDDNHKKCCVKIINIINNVGLTDYKIHIAIAPPKNLNRFEWFLEKATEIGIDEITPIITKHSEKINLKTERFNKIVVSAMKQSNRAYLPILNEQIDLNKLFKTLNSGYKLYIAHCEDNIKQNLKFVYKKGENALVLIGPEGDFSAEEIKKSLELGFIPVSLGKSRLRTETAALVACQYINFIND